MKFTLGRKNATAGNVSKETKPLSASAGRQHKGNSSDASEPVEIISKRSCNRKVYDNNNRCISTEYHDKAIHYFDFTDDTYKEIDNSLVDTGDGYETKSNRFKTRFNKRAKNGKIFEISKDACKVSLISIDAAKKGGCDLENCTCADGLHDASKVVLKNVRNNVDIEYTVDYERVKEDIIIKEKAESYEFSFDLALENLVAGLSTDGKKLELKKKYSGITYFYIPAPFMTDASGNRSEDVYYEISQESDNLVSINVIADKDWINAEGRAFPVTIDPQVVSMNFNGVYYEEEEYEASIFKYASYQNGKKIGNELRVYCKDQNYETIIESKLTIKKHMINSLFLANMISAKLIVPVDRSRSYDGNFTFNGEFYNYNSQQHSSYTFDIKDILLSGENEVILNFGMYNSPKGYYATCIFFNPPVLAIEYYNHVARLEITPDSARRDYFPGEYFDATGMAVTAVYENGDRVSLTPDKYKITPSGTVTTYDDYVTVSFDGVNAEYGINVDQRGFNDRRPLEGRENMYQLMYVNEDGTKAINTDIIWVKLSLCDGAESDSEIGTPLNATNLNNIYVHAENIIGEIKDENLPSRLK